MTPRTRRWLVASLGLVVLLFAGRWLASFLALRWWAGAISPDALATVSRRQLLGLGLDAAAVLFASAWFIAQGLLVTRSIGSVQVEHRLGNATVRELVPTRLLVLGAVATGLVLGVLSGAGARAWRGPLLLSQRNLRFGIEDPLLGVDVGELVARYPLWRELLGYWLTLVVLGLVLTTGLYLAIGGIRPGGGRTVIHPDARRHVGGLLAVLAASIGAWYLQAPFRIAVSLDAPLGLSASSLRLLAVHAAAGAALAIAAMSLAWAWSGRHSLLAAGWLVLGGVVVTERLVVPAIVSESSAPRRDAESRIFDQVMHQIELTSATPSPDTLPALTQVLDPEMLRDWAATRGGRMLGAAPALGDSEGAWLMAWQPARGESRVVVVRLADGTLSPDGQPRILDSVTWLPAGSRIAPGAAGWQRQVDGVPVGGILRRVALAWALQAPAILTLPASATIDWIRDPADRLATLMPDLLWVTEGPVVREGRLHWLVAGLATVGQAPLSTRIALDGKTVSGAVSALLALVAAEDGTVQLDRDPGNHPLGQAWAETYASMTSTARGPLGAITGRWYPASLFAGQLQVLTQPHWGLGVVPESSRADSIGPHADPTAGAGGAGWQIVLEDRGRGRSTAFLRAERRGGRPVIAALHLADPAPPPERELTAAWLRMPTPSQIADSLRATGDSLIAGPVRWHIGAAGPVAWQSFRSAATAEIRWVGSSWRAGVGGGRRPEEAWRALTQGGEGPPQPVSDVPGQLEAMRTWFARADSALRRGDLTAFGRAWEALRALLLQPPGRGPPESP